MKMDNIERLEIGKVSLVQEKNAARIIQIGLTKEQSDLLQMFVSSLSKEKPLIQLDEKYDLMLRCDCCYTPNLNNHIIRKYTDKLAELKKCKTDTIHTNTLDENYVNDIIINHVSEFVDDLKKIYE